MEIFAAVTSRIDSTWFEFVRYSNLFKKQQTQSDFFQYFDPRFWLKSKSTPWAKFSRQRLTQNLQKKSLLKWEVGLWRFELDYFLKPFLAVFRRWPTDETTRVIPALWTEVSRFSAGGFKFIADHPFVFLHCQLRICASENPNSRCARECLKGSRKKRDVNNEDKLYRLAQGPLTFDDDVEETKGNQKTVKGK